MQPRRIRRKIRHLKYKSNDTLLRRILSIRRQNTNYLSVNQFFNGTPFY